MTTDLLKRSNDAILAVYRAFGRPGDYGYSSREGKALQGLYNVQNELADATKADTTSGALKGIATAQAAEVLEAEVVRLQELADELVEALKDARHQLWELGVGEEALQSIRAAIAKAEVRP